MSTHISRRQRIPKRRHKKERLVERRVIPNGSVTTAARTQAEVLTQE